MHDHISLDTAFLDTAFLDYYNATTTASASDSIRTAEAAWLAAAAAVADEIAASAAAATDDPQDAWTLAEAEAKKLTNSALPAVQATIIKLAGDAASAAVVASQSYQDARDRELEDGDWTLEEVVRPTARHLHSAAERKWGPAFTSAKAERERHEHIFLDDALDRSFALDDRWGRD